MRKIRSDKVLDARAEKAVNTLRREYGMTINEVAAIFSTTKDVIVNADPHRKAMKGLH